MFNFIELSRSCAKGLLVVLNLLSILISLCTFGFAIVDINILKQYGEGQASGCFTGDVIVATASCALVAISVFGCIATLRDNVKLLYLYVGLVLMYVIFELMITIFVSLQRYGLQFRVTEWIREDFYKNFTDINEKTKHLKQWDDLQITYECCGLNNAEDYIILDRSISMSCCPRAYHAKTEYARKVLHKACIETTSYYEIGCEDVILDMLMSDGDYLLGVAVTSFLFEAVGIVLAMWVANHLRNSVQVYKHTVKY